jgi:hypothetical protein
VASKSTSGFDYSNPLEDQMDKKLPFIGQIISTLLLIIISAFFLDRLFALMFVVILVAVLIFRLETYSFTAAVLIAIATQFRLEANTRAFLIVVVMLIAGSAIELGAKAYVNRGHQVIITSKSIGRNTLFAVLGSAIPIIFVLPLCRDPQAIVNLIPAEAAENVRLFIPDYLLKLIGCMLEFVGRPFGMSLQEMAGMTVGEYIEQQLTRGASGLAILNQFLSFFLLLFAVNPSIWAALFAAIARAGITKPSKVFIWFILTSLVSAFIGFPIASFLATAVGFALILVSQMTDSFQPLQLVFVSMITLIIFIPSLAAGVVTSLGKADQYSIQSPAVFSN